MNADDWQNLIDFWKDSGHDIRFLDVPPQIAQELGIELPPSLETDMTEQQTETETGVQQNAFMKWKKKRYFDGETCGLKGCQRKADGYIMDLKPTKDARGTSSGKLWFGPACLKCIRKDHDTLMPMTLAELAHQRKGASDLALVLDVEVGDVLKRLEAAGIDEHGQALVGVYNPEGGTVGKVVPNAADPRQQTPPAVATQQPQAAIPAQQGALVTAHQVSIPTDSLAASVQESNELLTFLGSFHIVNQQQMDVAGQFLAEVKGKWGALDTLRKDLGAPLRDKLQEIQSFFNPALDALKKAEGILKQRITEGAQRAEEAHRKSLADAQAAHAQGDVQATALATQAAQAADVVMPATVQQRTTIKFEIIDKSQLPGNFWSPDPKLIQAAINAGHRQIPGVRIWEEQTLASGKVNP